jgi:hypothetical protein
VYVHYICADRWLLVPCLMAFSGGGTDLHGQVAFECFDCRSTAIVRSCESGAFDACDQSVVIGGFCLSMCADPCSRVQVRACPERVQGSTFRGAPDCAVWGSTQLFAFCILQQPGYPCSCDTSDPNAVLMLYPCDLQVPFRSVLKCEN